MKKAQRDKMYNIDEFEDLTLFANESFDTQDVDLFEFSSEESSPLTRLKSIILSLDWEINDEILQELADELVNLQAMWQGDKVAEVYLQGLDKIGKYIRGKGHYAHPNSIKLLLTFFYNFEKIISSQNITGEDITKILKGDIRKFKILQYQINQSETELTSPPSLATAPAGPTQDKAPVMPVNETDHVKLLKAAILSLDWEVTNESLKQYNVQLSHFREKVADNRFALVLVQGLQALGDYIGEERAEAHPEAFTLLHSFDEALELIAQLQNSSTDQNKVQEILVDQINRLNNLKLLISGPSTAKIDDNLIDDVVEEISTPVAADTFTQAPSWTLPEKEESQEEFPATTGAMVTNTVSDHQDDPLADTLGAEIDTLFAFGGKPAMESDSVQYPDEVLPPDAIHPVDDELADDLIEASLQSGRGLMPALSGAEEMSGFNEDAEPLDFPAQSDLAEQLDFLFSEAENQSEEAAATPPSFDVDEFALDEDLEDGPIAALADFEPDSREDDEHTGPAGLPSVEEPQLIEALSEADFLLEEETISEPAGSDENLLDIQSKLDTFFTDALTEEEEPVVAPDLAEDEAESEPEPEDTTIAALSDVEQPDYVDALGLEATETDPQASDIQDKLDSFFAEATEETNPPTSDAASVEEIEQSLFFSDDSPVESALASSDEERGFSETEALGALDFTPMEEIEEKLDFFFGSEGEEPASEVESDADAVGILPASSDLNLADAVASLKAPAIESTSPEPTDLTALANVETNQVSGDTDLLDNELEGQLDFFFDSTDDGTGAVDTEPVDALTLALEASIDDSEPVPELAALDDVLGEHSMPGGEERRHMQLAALGALLPGVVRNITRTKVADAEQAIATLQSEGLSSAQKALVELLHAAIGLLGHVRKADDSETEKLFNYLYEHILRPDVQIDILPEAITRYAAWMKGINAAMPFVPTPVEGGKDQHFEYTAQELYFELAELRANINQEFAKLRHEMQHRS